MAARFSTIETDGGHYIHDLKDDRIVGEPYASRFEAEIAADKRNRANLLRSQLFDLVNTERMRQDDRWGSELLHSGAHLAVLTKKLGDAASTLLTVQPRERSLEQELIEFLAVGLRWLEQLDAAR